MSAEVYENPLVTRYASRDMAALFSERRRAESWRRVWLALAEAQHELGLPVSAEQLAELRAHVTDIDLESARRHERRLRHDVMAHVHAYGDVCPLARPILHWGATSCDITDNGDLVILREALRLTARRVAGVIDVLAEFAQRHRNAPCLGFTHFQAAQPTTVGKRACLWAQDLAFDLAEIEHRLATLRFRGVKGATGTQASFLELFGGDHGKVAALERRVAEKMGFAECYPVTGQTYSRKIDAQMLDALGGVAQSAHKAGGDLRLLAHRKEIEEPFEDEQIGSSAMAYKRNPMRCERMCALARFAMNLAPAAAQTAAQQWLERTLDDSAARRLALPQAFLAVDAVLALYRNVAAGLVVYPGGIARNLALELPFLATENILMSAVKAGGDRQALHERIRQHSQAAAAEVKLHGRENDLFERLQGDAAFARVDWNACLDASRYVGRAPEQVDEFLAGVAAPIRARYPRETAAEEVRV